MFARSSKRMAPGVAKLSFLIAPLGLFAGADRARTEPGQLDGRMYPLLIDSGPLDNPTNQTKVVFSHVVDLGPDVAWLRVLFDDVSLPPGSRISVTSLQDGESQQLDLQMLAEWGNGTAFFNGPSVRIELFAAANAKANSLRVATLFAGSLLPRSEPVGASDEGQVATICGTDARVPWNDKTVGRLLPGTARPCTAPPCNDPSSSRIGYCSAFIIDNPSGTTDRFHLSAGHCFDPDGDGPSRGNFCGTAPRTFILQFNVPDSLPTCVIRHPHTNDQFPLNPATLISSDRGAGIDWALFKCGRNGANQTTFERQMAAVALANPVPGAANAYVIGYGLDGANIGANPGDPSPSHVGDNSECGNENVANGQHCDSGTAHAVRNATQQATTGPVNIVTLADGHTEGALLRHIHHTVDTCGANSGSLIRDDFTLRGLGIHTHGGCTSTGGSNAGTPADETGLRGAIDSGSVVTPCCGDGGCGSGENSCTCPTDCSGACCGNAVCEAGETRCTCPADCGASFFCGDAVCCASAGETLCNCPADCPGGFCEDGQCCVGENSANCPQDCGGAPDQDGDGVPDNVDNCPNVFNPGQEDRDGDLCGDACDPEPNNPVVTCIPAMSEWGLLVLGLLTLTAGTLVMRRVAVL